MQRVLFTFYSYHFVFISNCCCWWLLGATAAKIIIPSHPYVFRSLTIINTRILNFNKFSQAFCYNSLC